MMIRQSLLIGSRKKLCNVSLPYINIGDSHIEPSMHAQNLGAIFESNMSESFESHIYPVLLNLFLFIYVILVE